MGINKETFMLMQYGCTCGRVEVIWNSRNGKVPQSVACGKQGCRGVMTHVNWHLDMKRKNPTLVTGQRYFISITEARANEMAFEVCTKLQHEGKLSSDDFDAKLTKLTASFYGDGCQPELVTYYKPKDLKAAKASLPEGALA